MTDEYLAYIYIRRLTDRSIASRVGLSSVEERYVIRVLSGLLRQMDTSLYFADDSEVDKVAAKLKGKRHATQD